MNIFPSKRIKIESEKSALQVYQAIDEAVISGYNKNGVWKSGLVGERNGNEFILRKSINYGNSFLPVAYGKISEKGTSSTVQIKFQMYIFVQRFFYFIGFIFLVFHIFNDNMPNKILTAAMFIIFYIVMLLAFWLEFRDTSNRIKKLIG